MWSEEDRAKVARAQERATRRRRFTEAYGAEGVPAPQEPVTPEEAQGLIRDFGAAHPDFPGFSPEQAGGARDLFDEPATPAYFRPDAVLYTAYAPNPGATGRLTAVLTPVGPAQRYVDNPAGALAVWHCEHEHGSRNDALACAGAESSRRYYARLEAELSARSLGREPAPVSGPSAARVWTEPDKRYPGDIALCSLRPGQGEGTTRIRLTPAGQVLVGEAVLGPEGVRDLVIGYLGAVLREAALDEPAPGEIGPGPDVRALRRVMDKIRGAQ
jgi:hypothetical protein